MVTTLFAIAYLCLILAFLVFFLWIIISLISLIRGNAPFVPVRDHALSAIVSELNLRDDSLFVEVGCGDGKVLIAAAKAFPDTRMVGIELNFAPYLIAKWKTRSFPNITILRKNFFDHDFSEATHLYTYLFPKVMDDLLPLLNQQLKSGTVLVSCDFLFSEKGSEKIISLSSKDTTSLAKKLAVYHW